MHRGVIFGFVLGLGACQWLLADEGGSRASRASAADAATDAATGAQPRADAASSFPMRLLLDDGFEDLDGSIESLRRGKWDDFNRCPACALEPFVNKGTALKATVVGVANRASLVWISPHRDDESPARLQLVLDATMVTPGRGGAPTYATLVGFDITGARQRVATLSVAINEQHQVQLLLQDFNNASPRAPVASEWTSALDPASNTLTLDVALTEGWSKATMTLSRGGSESPITRELSFAPPVGPRRVEIGVGMHYLDPGTEATALIDNVQLTGNWP